MFEGPYSTRAKATMVGCNAASFLTLIYICGIMTQAALDNVDRPQIASVLLGFCFISSLIAIVVAHVARNNV